MMRLPKCLALVILFIVILLFIPNQKVSAQFYEIIEWQIFEMVNQERDNRGLPALQMDSKLRDMARAHSKDMGDNRFYNHISPTTGTIEDRFYNNNISFTTIAENINKFPWGSAQTAMYGGTVNNFTAGGWMYSQGHKDNILSPNQNYIGIGVYRSSDGEYSYTQKFVGYHTPPSTILQPPTTTVPSRWTRITSATAIALAYDNGRVVASYPSGTWLYQNGNWSRITISVANALAYDNGRVLASYPSGTWFYQNGNWSRITTSVADALAYDNGRVLASYPSGTWVYYNGNWIGRISVAVARELALKYNNNVLAGSYSNGTFLFNIITGNWTRISTTPALSLDIDDVLIASYPSGTWLYQNGNWSRITTSVANALAYDNGRVVVSYPSGTWFYQLK